MAGMVPQRIYVYCKGEKESKALLKLKASNNGRRKAYEAKSHSILEAIVETPLFATMLVQPQPPAVEEEDDVEVPNAPALEITKLKQRVRKLERKRRIKHSGLKRLRKGSMKEDVTAAKEVNAADPIVFDNEEVAKRMQDEELEQAVAREKQEKEDLERAKVLQQKYDQKQENIDWNVVVEQMQEKHLDTRKNKRKRIWKELKCYNNNMIKRMKILIGILDQYLKENTTVFKPFLSLIEMKNLLRKELIKKLRVEVEVLGSHTIQQDTTTVDPAKMSEEDV
nr:hypothetical protein [Tanacetum cinerariifolium]